ncbi:hypothetical protein [Niabella hirudinis]|uniref:hypothetical protein n=1 Tax=Niabella hirudinis TaxID=1285929 RepID=UPI003EBFAA07
MQEKINRDNCETYFLLYVDHELNNAARAAVEQFLQQHPDMKPLMEALIRTRQAADSMIVFPDRSKLLFGTAPVTDEELLSYIDGEAVSEAALDQLKDPSPELAKRLQAFESTRSKPEMQIVFPDKALLYRTPKLVAIRKWGMVAAAAVVVIAMGAGAWMLGQQKRAGLAVAGPSAGAAGQTAIARVTPQAVAADTVPAAGEGDTKMGIAADIPAADSGADPVTAKKETKTTNPAPLPAVARQPSIAPRQPAPVAGKTDVPLQPETRPAIAKQDLTPPAIAEPDPLTQQAVAVASDEKQPKTKKSLFKKLTRHIEERVAETLTGNEGQVTIAGFAVNVK